MALFSYQNIECDVHVHAYPQSTQLELRLVVGLARKNQRLGLWCGESVATVSTFIPGYRFNEDETVIDNTDVNEGVLDILVGAGIIVCSGIKISRGNKMFPLVKVCRQLS